MPAIWNSYSKSETARKPAQDDARALLVDEIHQQARKRHDFDVRIRREHLARHRHALVES